MNDEERILKEIKDVLKELDEQGRMKYTQKYMQHSDISVYKHCISVAYTSVELADRLAWNVNRRELIRGALLHDYFLYDWHEKNAGHRFHGFIHAGRALQNARKDFKLTIREENIILRHMFPLNVVPPMCKEAWLVCLADKICASKIFHFGTLSFTHAGIRTASQYAIQCAKEAGALISFDPNLREPLWENLEDARKAIEYGMECCDILKISDNELTFMTGEKDYDKGAVLLQQKYQIPLVCVTLGKDGSRAYYKGLTIKAEPFLQKNTIETTGAGDTFTGCMLNTVLDKGLDNLTGEDIRGMLRFANAGAALITTKRGALRVMPEKEEIEALLEEQTE